MMRRVFLVLLFTLALLPGISPAKAQPDSTVLLALADYLPYDTLAYITVRTDPGYIETLDALIRPLATALPPGALPAGTDLSLTFLLDVFTQQTVGGSFVDDVRHWLGDTATLALSPDLSSEVRTRSGLYIRITDRAAATAFIERFVESRRGTPFERRDTPAATIFSSPLISATFRILVTDDLLIVGSNPAVLSGSDMSELTLSDNPDFQDALAAALRDAGDSYNIVLYVDVPGIIADSFRARLWVSDEERLAALTLLRAVGPLAGVATVLREDDAPLLTFDLTLRAGNLTTLRGMGFDLGTSVRLNPAFASVIPSDAALMWHGTQPLGFVDLMLANYPVVQPYVYNLSFNLFYNRYNPAINRLLVLLSREFEKFPTLVSGGLFGLDYETEVLNWLGGDYAFFVRATPPDMTRQPMYTGLEVFDFALVAQVFNAERSRRAMRTLQRELPNTLRIMGSHDIDIRVLPETIGEAAALCLLIGQPFSDDLPPYELIVAADGDLFVLGSRRAVMEALTGGSGEAFALGDAAWPNAALNTAVSGPEIARLLALFAPAGSGEVEVMRALLVWVERASFSLMVNGEGDTVLRAALLLNSAENITAHQATLLSLTSRTRVPESPESTEEAGLSRFDGIPWQRAEDGAYLLGNPDAPITIILFSDFLCPACQSYKLEMDRFINTYVLTGRARYEYRTLVTAGGDRTRFAAQLVECAAELLPGSYYDAVDVMFALAMRGALDANMTRAFADAMALDSEALQTCAQTAGQYRADQSLAIALGANSTPSVFVRRGDAAPEPVGNQRSFAALADLVE